jgi:hypothetical protein
MRGLMFAIVCGGLLFGAINGADKAAARRMAEAQALSCARASVADFESPDAGTDSAIAACYTSRGLALPADL